MTYDRTPLDEFAAAGSAALQEPGDVEAIVPGISLDLFWALVDPAIQEEREI